jgi:hypothetical protein
MKILRYTDKVQEALSEKTKAEPWMHIALAPLNLGPFMVQFYAIYVWDTREVVETGELKDIPMLKLMEFGLKPRKNGGLLSGLPVVKDSMVRLKGSGKIINELNDTNLFYNN